VLKKIFISNYRVFRSLTLDFNEALNVLVGNNDAGKSTLLEAVHLGLTGRLRGRSLEWELSPFLFNQDATAEYVAKIQAGSQVRPPSIVIELFLDECQENAGLRGSNNSLQENTCGLRLEAAFCDDFIDEYRSFITEPNQVTLVPTEYFEVTWRGFNGNSVTSRSVNTAASLIDATNIRLQSGADRFLQQVISEQLAVNERAELSRAYRSLREQFSGNESIETINQKLAATQHEVSDKELSLSIDISQKTAWETSLVPHLDDLPFQFVGSGAQSVLKILLALNHAADRSNVLLCEEPENHQSPGSLNVLVRKIAQSCEGKQVLLTTHSSFVLNKLGLDNLVLLTPARGVRLGELPPETLEYFKKLSGYDTLRIVLARRVILVEGPSDELLVQRAYRDAHDGKLPLADHVDVINVRGLSFKRFLDIAKPIGVSVDVVTDNDGKDPDEVLASYSAYTDADHIRVHVGSADAGATLEPQLVYANGREALNAIFGRSEPHNEALVEWMSKNKTTCALTLFETEHDVLAPSYIRDAVV
jgi:putative ATP-dependent endonuclease of the OLD family